MADSNSEKAEKNEAKQQSDSQQTKAPVSRPAETKLVLNERSHKDKTITRKK